MAKIVIKKKIDLGFLGEDVKGHLLLKAMPITEYEGLLDEIGAAEGDGKRSLMLTLKVLTDHFLEGEYNGEKLEADDIGQFDVASVARCFEIYTGQDSDPKD